MPGLPTDRSSRLVPAPFAAAVLTGVAIALAAGPAVAQPSTWIGGSSDWNTAGNWSPFGVPNASTAAVQFTDTSVGTVNISSSVTAQSVTFTNQSGIYTLTSGANQVLTLAPSGSAPPSITMLGGQTATATVNLTNLASGSLLFTSGNLTIANNTPNGGSLVIGPNTVIGTPSTGGVIVTGPGATFLSGSFAPSGGSPNNQVVGGLLKTGPGLLDFSGNGTNLFGAQIGTGLTLAGGSLNLDYSSNTAAKLGSGALVLNGGNLQFTANSGTPVTQSFSNNTTVGGGHTDVKGNGTGTVTLNAGTITHTLGGTADFTPSTGTMTFNIQTSAGNNPVGGLLGTGPAFATVNGGANWAVQSGVVVAGLAGYSVNIFGSGNNTDVTANANPAAFTTNSLRFNTGPTTLTLSGTNTLQSGGVLVTGNAIGGTITGGTLTAPSSGELLFHVYNSGFFVASNLVSTAGLTKTGPGTLNLGGINTGLTGPINVNRGGLFVASTTAAVNSASAINFNDLRSGLGLQSFVVSLPTGTNGTITPPIRVSAFSPFGDGTTFGASGGNSIVTLAGQITSAAGQTTPIQFNSVAGSGFNLTFAANSFTGAVDVLNGSLGVTADAVLGNANNTLSLESGPTDGGLVFLNGGVTVARPVVLNFDSRVVSNGTDSNTISGAIAGTGGLVKAGTGTLTISNPAHTFTGGVTVTAGTLTLGSTGILAQRTNITVAAGATFSFGTSSNAIVSEYGVVTLNGGTLAEPGNGSANIVNQIVTGPAGGTVDFTGATGATQLQLNGLLPPAITVNGNSTWLSPGNGGSIAGPFATPTPFTIAPGVTLTNGIALASGSSFLITGGGTLYQNSDATDVLAMGAALTVAAGTTFRVTDASSNGGVGNIGTGSFTLDGGTFAYGGGSATTLKPISLTTNGGTIRVETAATTLVATFPITGLGGLTKTGPGTLVLGSSGNTFNGLTVNAGTVQTGNDNTLGTGSITVNPGATLNFSASTGTSRTINLVFGTLSVASGATLNLTGAAVNGGFVVGPGTVAVTGGSALTGVTTYGSTAISHTGAGSYVNFTNGGPLSVAAGAANTASFTRFTNQGSGSITLGAGSVNTASDFETYGPLNLAPGTTAVPTQLTNTGTTPLNFNGGSRTFIATQATASQFAAGIDLHGQNAVVAGGLLVNNGFIIDSTAGSPGRVIADFGSLVKGAGFFQGPVITQNGGRFQAGNSPGRATFGSFAFGPGGVNDYVFAINDATGFAGPTPDGNGQVSGWGLIRAVTQAVSGNTPGDFAWTADSAHPLMVAINTLVNPTTAGTDVAGPMAHFDPDQPYSWPAVTWAGSYAGPADAAALDAATTFDSSGVANPVRGIFGWSLDTAGQTLSLTYTPSAVPEPTSLALASAAGLGVGWAVRRRRRR